jgi:aerobic-type carbon monoxide dehydrogenase small subunit (CoxS/CutS family)
LPDKFPIVVTVNGEYMKIEVDPSWLLADVLREQLELTGTHIGCEQGVCGACTILLDGDPVRSCLLLAAQVNQHNITTVEGLAPTGELNALQSAMRRNHGLQCGFCTPGFLMTATAVLERDRATLTKQGKADRQAVRDMLSGNLCRCTGYTGIVDAVIEVLEMR